MRTERKWKVPLAAMHMLAAVAWFVTGSLSFAWALVHGPGGFGAFRSNFLVAFVGGWLVQTLLGARHSGEEGRGDQSFSVSNPIHGKPRCDRAPTSAFRTCRTSFSPRRRLS